MKILFYSEEQFNKAIELVKHRCYTLLDFKKELSFLADPNESSIIIVYIK